jgi:hypothetical protein
MNWIAFAILAVVISLVIRRSSSDCKYKPRVAGASMFQIHSSAQCRVIAYLGERPIRGFNRESHQPRSFFPRAFPAKYFCATNDVG